VAKAVAAESQGTESPLPPDSTFNRALLRASSSTNQRSNRNIGAGSLACLSTPDLWANIAAIEASSVEPAIGAVDQPY